MGFASVQANPHSISIWLKTDLQRVKHSAYLNCSREESSSADVHRNGEKEQSKPLDFLTSGSGSDSLMNCPRSLTLPNVIFLRRGVKNHVGDHKNFGIIESCIWLYNWLHFGIKEEQELRGREKPFRSIFCLPFWSKKHSLSVKSHY